MKVSDKYPPAKYRTEPLEVWSRFSALFAEVFGDIARLPTRELLSKCYCDRRTREFDEAVFPEVIKQYIQHYVEGKEVETPIVIYGPVGCGKSTYIHHKLDIILADKKELPIVPFFFDFRDIKELNSADKLEATFHTRLYKCIVAKFPDLDIQPKSEVDAVRILEKLRLEVMPRRLGDFVRLYETQRGQFSPEERLQREYQRLTEICEDKATVNADMLRFLRDKLGNTVVVVFDNLDHRYYSDRFLDWVYSLANDVMTSLKLPVILAMRNYTLLDSYNVHSFQHIEPSRSLSLAMNDIRALILKRVEYTFNVLPEEVEIQIRSGKLRDSLDNVRETSEPILYSLVNNEDIYNFLCGVCGQDLRMLMELIVTALSSGHLVVEERQAKKSILYTSFVKACLYGNSEYYFPSDKRIPDINLFDSDNPIGYQNTLVKIRTLQLLNYLGVPTSIRTILDEMRSIGYDRMLVMKTIEEFTWKNLVNRFYYISKRHPQAYLEPWYFTQEISLSDSGRYYLDLLCQRPEYVELVIPSTNLPDFLGKVIEASFRQQTWNLEAYENKKRAVDSFLNFLEKLEGEEEQKVEPKARPMYNQFAKSVAKPLQNAFNAYYYRFLRR